MPLWQWVADSAGFVFFAVLVYGVALVVRRRLLSRNGGTFELSVRLHPERDPGHGWALGLGRYHEDGIEWFRIFSLWPGPRRTWRRTDLRYASQREPEGRELMTLYAGHLVVVCESPSGEVDMAMSPSALTGFQSWLEAAPPGAESRALS